MPVSLCPACCLQMALVSTNSRTWLSINKFELLQVPARMRNLIYAFDRSFEMALAALAAPIVGWIAEYYFGFQVARWCTHTVCHDVHVAQCPYQRETGQGEYWHVPGCRGRQQRLELQAKIRSEAACLHVRSHPLRM